MGRTVVALTPDECSAIVRLVTGASSQSPSSDRLRVVDPMRIPGSAAAQRVWDRQPKLSQAFVVLACIDVVIRALGLFGTRMYLDLSAPLSLLTAFLPHDALILLPAILLFRRPDAASATPLVMQGAILLAIVEFAGEPLRGLTSGNPASPIAGPALISIAASLLTAAAWVTIARGLAALDPTRADATTLGLSNLVAGVILIGAVVSLALVLLLPATNLGDPTWRSLLQLNSAMSVIPSLAFAYLAREVVRGKDDDRRPPRARSTGTAAMVLVAIGSVITAITGLFALAQSVYALPGGGFLGAVSTGISLFAGPLAMTAFIVAFGLGLAAQSATIEAPEGSEPTTEEDSVHWPTPRHW